MAWKLALPAVWAPAFAGEQDGGYRRRL